MSQNHDFLTDNGRALADEVRSMLRTASDVIPAMERITRRADAVLDHHVKAIAASLGPPPASFALVLFGSEGRGEQTFKTDQDNAIIFGDLPAGEAGLDLKVGRDDYVGLETQAGRTDFAGVESAADRNFQVYRTVRAGQGGTQPATEWFLEFGKTLNDRLNESGYAFCKGGIMAGNPKWCVPVTTWKKYFRSWVLNPEPMDVMQSSIFFDMRYAYGDEQLTAGLRDYLDTLLADRSDIFFYHMVQNALKVQVPPATLRRFWLWFQRRIDLKYMLMPVVGLARIMALRHRVRAIGTADRIRQLSEAGILEKGRAAMLMRSF